MSVGGEESMMVALTLDSSPAAQGVAGAVSMFRGILDVLREAREQSDHFAESTTKVRDSLRDIRALSGAGPVTDEFLRTHLQFIRDTGATQTQAHDFLEQFLGEAEAYRSRMDPEQFKSLQTLGIQYGATLGGDIGAHAKILGRLVGMGPQGETAEDVLGQFAEVTRIMNYGSGELSLAMKSLSNAAAFTIQEGGTGPVGSARNLAILGMGASRLGSESTIDTTIGQFMRATTGGGSEKWREYLRGDVAEGGLGIKEGTKIEDAMIPLFRAMEKVANIPALTGTREDQARQAQAIAAGGTQQGRDLDTWLREQGITSMEERRAVIGMYSQRHTMMELLGTAPEATGANVKQTVEAMRASPAGKQALAEAGVFATETEVGIEHEPMRYFLTRARDELTKDRASGFAGVPADVFTQMTLGKVGTDQQSVMLFQRAQEIAERELHQRFERQEPGLLARATGAAALGLPRIAAGLVGMFAPGTGAHMAQEMARDQESVTGWVARRQGLGIDPGHFMTEIARAQGLRETRAWDVNTIVGGEFGRETTVGEFRTKSAALGRDQARIERDLAALVAAMQRQPVRPIAVPTKGQQVK